MEETARRNHEDVQGEWFNMKTIAENFDIVQNFIQEQHIKLDRLTWMDFSEDDTFMYLCNKNHFSFHYGATRGCFVIDDVVFKFDFCNVSESYCKIEEDRYQLACIEGLEDIFVPTNLYDVIGNTLIYTQPRVDVIGGFDYSSKLQRDDPIYNRIKNITSKIQFITKLPIEWIQDAYLLYGEETFQRFCNFIDTYYINDLSGHNVGYIQNRPVIFDYAGFEEDTD